MPPPFSDTNLVISMMPRPVHLLALLLIPLACACSRKPETLIEEGYDQKAMDEAIARARQEVDYFIAALEKGEGTDFAVKAPIEDDGKVEHFWLTDVAYRDGVFEGTIGNDPGIVDNVEFGQNWTINRSEISDWMFLRDEKIYGNYTMRPLLETMPEEEAEMWRSQLAEP